MSEGPLKVWCWRATFPSGPLRGWSCLPLPALSIPSLVASQLQPLPPASHGCLLPCSSWSKISSLKDTSHIRLVYTLIQHDFIVAWLHLWRLLPQKLRFPGKELGFMDIWGRDSVQPIPVSTYFLCPCQLWDTFLCPWTFWATKYTTFQSSVHVSSYFLLVHPATMALSFLTALWTQKPGMRAGGLLDLSVK